MFRMLSSESGQSTLEYALVLSALLVSVVVLGAIVTMLQNPMTFESVVESSAHTLAGSDVVGGAQDLAVF